MKTQEKLGNQKRRFYHIKRQPDETTCGPTSLHSIYNFYGDNISIEEVISEIKQEDDGGTFASILGTHSLKRGYSAKLYTVNMKIFDPSWFNDRGECDSRFLINKLLKQARFKKSHRFINATNAYIEFLENGGKILLEDLNAQLLQKYLRKDIPIISGLSSTFLYRSKREFNDKENDIKGESTGHFVVLYDYDKQTRLVSVADPYRPRQMKKKKYYKVNLPRLVCAILLGVLSYDANLLIIERPKTTLRK